MKIKRPLLIVFVLAMCSTPWLLRQTNVPGDLTSASPTEITSNPTAKHSGKESANEAKASTTDLAPEPGPNIATYAIKTIPVSIPQALPPLNSPLENIIEDLRTRAARGEPAAQCRLSFELGRCKSQPVLRQRMDEEINRAARSAGINSNTTDAIANLKFRIAEIDRLCQNIDIRKDEKPWELLLRAANNGHIPSMSRFAIWPPLDENNFLNDIEGWQAYQDNAARLLQTAASRGDPSAAFQIAWIRSGMPAVGGAQILPIDLTEARTYLQIAQHFATGPGARTIANMLTRIDRQLTPDQMAAAQQRAQTYLPRFSNTAPNSIDFTNNILPRDPSECDKVRR